MERGSGGDRGVRDRRWDGAETEAGTMKDVGSRDGAGLRGVGCRVEDKVVVRGGRRGRGWRGSGAASSFSPSLPAPPRLSPSPVSPSPSVSDPRCVSHFSQYVVHLGAHSLRQQDGCEQTRTATQSFPHPDFNNSLPNKDHRNDIMLVKMMTPAQLTWAVRPLTLSRRCVPAGANCLISGWGTMSSPQCRGSRGARDGEGRGTRL